jgi:L-ascorbate metabolism protein UlaG (beta-lactamase superfamily)
MRVKWLGHACFLITSRDGLRLITDPYAVGGGINYSPINEAADVVLVSHGHDDHSNISTVKGKPEVVRSDGIKTTKYIQFKGVTTYHDEAKGGQRGLNTIFCFTIDDIKLCHLGDLGHVLNREQINEIGAVDIIFVPVGGFFTIDASAASQVCDQLGPKIIIPMHYKTPKCTYPIAGVEDFLKGKNNVKRIDNSEVDFELENLPVTAEIVILQPAM